jgi:preprotein translocase subunit SecE
MRVVRFYMATKEKAIGSKGSLKSSGSGGSRKSRWTIPPELFQASVYKRNQGRTVRMVTAVTFGVIIALSAWRLYQTLSISTANSTVQWAAPGAVLFLGWWICFRLVHIPKFADFLIAVEAEMTKVSWPTKTELIRSSMVVIFFIVSLAAILFVFDLFWRTVFQFIGII